MAGPQMEGLDLRPSPSFSLALRDRPRVVPASPALGAVRELCESCARRSGLRKPRGGGQMLRHHHRGQRTDLASRNGQNASAEGRPVQSSVPAPCAPFPLPHPFRPHSRSALPTPSWLRTLQTARPASLSKKIETIDKRKNYIYTQPTY